MKQDSMNNIRQWIGYFTGFIYVFLLIKQFFYPEAPMISIPFHVFMTMSLVFLFVPLKFKGNINIYTFMFDAVSYILSISLVIYYWVNVERNQLRFQGIDPVFIGESLAFFLGIPLLLETVRRTTGWALVIIVLVFILYGFGILDVSGFLGFSSDEFIEITMLGNEGVFGVAANAMVTMVFFFVLFGSVFSATGGGDIFIDLALKLSGRYTGGAAKSAIIASSLFGTISGAAIANVTSTGVLTIPLMKRTGYTPEQAAATEAVASTGGQLMPPIMGVAAFVMADLLGVSYTTIAVAGIIPALGYYIALLFSVDLLARKKGIGSINADDFKKNLSPLLPRAHLLLSPIIIITGLFSGFSVPLCALLGTLSALILPFFRKNTRYSIIEIPKMVIDCAIQMAKISVAVSAVGIIIAISIQSGIAIEFVSLLADIGKDNLILSLFLVILGCITLGMGLPTVAAYIISAVIFAPALINLGVEPIAAHFFILYYSVLSMLTPPVCLAAFAAAGIAKADANKTGIVGLSIALVIFILPFGFVRDTSLLGNADIITIVIASIGILFATVSWAIALQGWLWKKLNIIIRMIFASICFFIIYEKTLTFMWGFGVVSFILLVVYLYFNYKKSQTVSEVI